MAMNREQKRMLRKQGELDADDQPTRPERSAPQPRPASDRVGPREYLGEVRTELKKVAWPTRNEVINSSLVVIVTLVLVTVLIAVLDWLFGQASLWLFDI